MSNLTWKLFSNVKLQRGSDKTQRNCYAPIPGGGYFAIRSTKGNVRCYVLRRNGAEIGRYEKITDAKQAAVKQLVG